MLEFRSTVVCVGLQIVPPSQTIHVVMDSPYRVTGVFSAFVNLRAFTLQHDPVAFFEIGDALRQRSQRQRVGAEKHLPPSTIAQHQRRTEPAQPISR